MRLRCFIFRVALQQAHKSMNLGSLFPITALPSCYHSEEYSREFTNLQKSAHVVVGKGQYTYWFDDGERVTNWSSWTAGSMDEFIRRFYHSKIHGEFAVYPLIITQFIYGLQVDFLRRGKVNEFDEKRLIVKNMIVQSLESHLKSFSYRVIARILAIL